MLRKLWVARLAFRECLHFTPSTLVSLEHKQLLATIPAPRKTSHSLNKVLSRGQFQGQRLG